MFSTRNKQNNVYPCKPQFYYIKVGLRGSKLYRHVFVVQKNLLLRGDGGGGGGGGGGKNKFISF